MLSEREVAALLVLQSTRDFGSETVPNVRADEIGCRNPIAGNDELEDLMVLILIDGPGLGACREF